MVAGAVARGHVYLGLTDHAENLHINGISREGMLSQRRIVRDLEQQRGDIRLFHGAELNIGVDGSLDYDAEFLAGYDWLVASVHSHFTRPVAEQTARVVAAIRHPSVTAIGHLHGRMIGKRPGIELDLETGPRRGRRDRHGDRDQLQPASPRRVRRGHPRGRRPRRHVRDLNRRALGPRTRQPPTRRRQRPSRAAWTATRSPTPGRCERFEDWVGRVRGA